MATLQELIVELDGASFLPRPYDAAGAIHSAITASVAASGPTTITGTVGGLSTVYMTSGAFPGWTRKVLTITSIVLSPSSPSVAAGSSEQFTATATFNDTTTGNATSQVVWTTSDATIATINSAGLALGVSKGPVTILATGANGAVVGTTTLTVT
jgi:trimeric autotransporter adhesin